MTKHNTVSPLSFPVPPGTPSFGDCIVSIAVDTTLAKERRRDMISGLTRVAEVLSRAPDAVPVHVLWLQPLLEEVMPKALGISAKTWANILSNMKAALAHLGFIKTSTKPAGALSPSWATHWQALRQSSESGLVPGLLSFVAYLDDEAINPEMVGDGHLTDYLAFVSRRSLRKDPVDVARRARRAWNRAAKLVPGWPRQLLEPIASDRVYCLPDARFAVGFIAEIDALLHSLAKPDPLAPGKLRRAMRPDTVKARRGQFTRFGAVLVHAGLPIESIGTIKDLVVPANLERGLRWLLQRSNNTVTPGLSNMAVALRTLIRHHVTLSNEERTRAEDLCTKVILPRTFGLTEKNRKRLMPFNDGSLTDNFLSLPQTLWTTAKTRRNPIERARQRETAIALEILTFCPIRRKNLAEIHVERDLQRHRPGNVVLNLQADQTKTGRAISFVLPDHLVGWIDEHLRERTGLLCPSGVSWLFPRRDGTMNMVPSSLGSRISEVIKRHMGLKVHPHLYRHLSAKLILKANPGHYELVRRVLGHSETSTTWETYVGLEGEDATRLLSEMVYQNRSTERPLSKSARKTGTGGNLMPRRAS
jgi:integrase